MKKDNAERFWAWLRKKLNTKRQVCMVIIKGAMIPKDGELQVMDADYVLVTGWTFECVPHLIADDQVVLINNYFMNAEGIINVE
jgi:hypothetical protein